MAWTLTTLKAAIQDYLQVNETTFVDNLDTIILQAEDRIIKDLKVLPNFRKTATAVTTTGNREVTLPSDFLAPLSIKIDVDDTDQYRWLNLVPKEPSFIYEAFPADNTTGTPKYYAVTDDETIILGPAPSGDQDVSFEYYYKPESITVAASGTTWIGDNMEASLLAGCLIEAYVFLKGEADLIATYDKRYKEALASDRALVTMSYTDEFRRG